MNKQNSNGKTMQATLENLCAAVRYMDKVTATVAESPTADNQCDFKCAAVYLENARTHAEFVVAKNYF